MDGIPNIEDPVHEAFESAAGSSQMRIAASVVEEAVHAESAARFPMRKPPWLGRVFDVPDVDALLVGVLPGRAVQEREGLLQGGDHEATRDLELQRDLAGLLRSGNKPEVVRSRRIGHVYDRPARVPEMGQVEVVPAVDFLHGHLKTWLAMQIVMGDHFDVLGKGLFARHLGTSFPEWRSRRSETRSLHRC